MDAKKNITNVIENPVILTRSGGLGYLARTPIGLQPMIGVTSDTEAGATEAYIEALSEWRLLLQNLNNE